MGSSCSWVPVMGCGPAGAEGGSRVGTVGVRGGPGAAPSHPAPPPAPHSPPVTGGREGPGVGGAFTQGRSLGLHQPLALGLGSLHGRPGPRDATCSPVGRVFGPALGGGVLSACDRAVHWETSRSPPPPLAVSAGQRGHQSWASAPQKTSDSQLSLTMSPPPFCPQRPPPHQLNQLLRTSGRSQPLRDTPSEP